MTVSATVKEGAYDSQNGKVKLEEFLNAKTPQKDEETKEREGFGDDNHDNNNTTERCQDCQETPAAEARYNPPRTQSTNDDVWAITNEEEDDSENFRDLSTSGKVKRICIVTLRIIGVLACLYFFICSLGLMSSAFQILGGKTGGQLFTNDVVGNPISGLIIGILVTVLVQSSSTSTSIIITMVGAGILAVHQAIPIIMGANIGTSVTNTIVSLTQSVNRDQFRKSFAGATVLDMFNFLTVIILLPIEVLTGYLESLTGAILSGVTLKQGEDARKTLADYTTERVIQVNQTLIQLVAQEIPYEDDASMVKTWCEQREGVANITHLGNSSACNYTTTRVDNCTVPEVVTVGVRKCDTKDFLFANTGMTDAAVGSILLVISLFVLTFCLIMMVKLLSSMLKGSVSRVIKKVINTNFRRPFGWVSGYLAILVGAVLTFLVQSSSVFTSTMTPLVGIGVISLKRMYPLTLGANIGTTGTGIIAAFASTSVEGMKAALQLSLCHLFFNITGIIIWYPVPLMRKVPVSAAMALGNTTAKYRWFAVMYMICAFFVLPGVFLALSFAGAWVLRGVVIAIFVIVIFVVVVNLLQNRRPKWLPVFLRTWEFLPKPLRSLEPYDHLICRNRCNNSAADPEDPTRSDSGSLCSSSAASVTDVSNQLGVCNDAFVYEEKSTKL